MFALGHFASILACPDRVRFPPHSGNSADIAAWYGLNLVTEVACKFVTGR